ncbi:hypothetical protein D7V80_12965 [Corallococcus sp. CA054B]|uniref:hypothetical protein n=1 Tax=Corallococcus sp. CA054B TaxID=2316734 RepID=UPI000EA0A8DA|nr:hypothetical protein [Corallococcus sp. CA054B]RKG68312.1 hypothetical protein D7V80_12965 [Corallococcus sp. CA054B]
MGWLKDQRWKGREGVSFLVMARCLREDPEWRKNIDFSEDSLATYLGQMDRGMRPRALERHPMMLRLLANYLEMPLEDVEAALESPETKAAESLATFDLWDAGIRPLDLRKDSLPPAVFPPEVLDPRQWPVLWTAPRGSARTLVGRWLAVRKSVHFIHAETWEQAVLELPPRATPCFVALKSGEGLPAAKDLPSGFPICVALDDTPVQKREPIDASEVALLALGSASRPSHPWRTVNSAPVEQWIEPLVHWLGERLRNEAGDEGRQFSPLECMAWLRAEILPLGMIDSFGTAVGFIGLYAEYLCRPTRRGATGKRGILDLSRMFLRRRLQRSDGTGAVPAFSDMERFLHRLAGALLTRSDRSWEEGQSLQDWQALVHEPPGREILAWLEQPAIRKKLKLDERAIREASRELSPSTFMLIRALQQTQLLREQAPNHHVLRPRWVFAALLQQQADELLNQAPVEWGEVLLRGHGASMLLSRLRERVRHGDLNPVERIIESWDPGSAACVASLEGAFVVLGWSVLAGWTVPRKLIEAVFHLQRRVVTEYNAIPMRRIGYDRFRDVALLQSGAWYLAAHALSEGLKLPRERVHPLLNPWMGVDGDDNAAHVVFGDVARLIEGASLDVEMRLAACALYGRLRGRIGSMESRVRPVKSLQLLEVIVCGVEKDDLDWREMDIRWMADAYLPLLRPYAERQGWAWPRFVRGIWKTWLAGKVRAHELMNVDSTWGKDILEFIPPEAFLEPELMMKLTQSGMPHDRFGPAQWDAFLQYWKRAHHDTFTNPGDMVPWRRMPSGVRRQALLEDVLSARDEPLRAELWKVDLETLRGALETLLQEGRWDSAWPVVVTAPPEETETVVRLLQDSAPRAAGSRTQLLRWLSIRIANRVSGWESAWQLLVQLTPEARLPD